MLIGNSQIFLAIANKFLRNIYIPKLKLALSQWHRHVTLVLAAQAFLSVLRYHVEPLPELSIPPFFSTPVAAGGLAVFRVARGLSSV